MATRLMPGMSFTIVFVSPWAMKPEPRMATRIGFPASARARNAVSTTIIDDAKRDGDAGGARAPRSGSTDGGRRSGSDGHASLDFAFDLAQRLEHLIFVRDDAHRQRPAQSQPGIVI